MEKSAGIKILLLDFVPNTMENRSVLKFCRIAIKVIYVAHVPLYVGFGGNS